jgi:SAM-dependent methyltransferase
MENRGSIAALESAAKCGRRLRHWGNVARLRAWAVRDFFLGPKCSIKSGTKEYHRHLREEVEHYSKLFAAQRLDAGKAGGNLFEPVPAVWQVAQERSAALLREKTGGDVTDHLIKRLQKRPGVRMASLGCGPGGVELMLAAEAPTAEYFCMDINEELIHLGRERALAAGLPVRFKKADLNQARLPGNQFDIVFCHASFCIMFSSWSGWRTRLSSLCARTAN